MHETTSDLLLARLGQFDVTRLYGDPGDSGETLRALWPYLDRKTDRAWREQIERSVRESDAVLDGSPATSRSARA